MFMIVFSMITILTNKRLGLVFLLPTSNAFNTLFYPCSRNGLAAGEGPWVEHDVQEASQDAQKSFTFSEFLLSGVRLANDFMSSLLAQSLVITLSHGA